MTDYAHTDTQPLQPLDLPPDPIDYAEQAAAQSLIIRAESFETAQNALGSLYQQAEAAGDETALAHVMTTWERVQALAAASQQLEAAQAGLVDLARTVQQQRAELADELNDLTSAIRVIDTDNPLIEQLVEKVQLGTEEILHDQMYDSLIDNIQHVLGITWREARIWIDLMHGHTPHESAIDEMIDQLRALQERGS